MRDWADLFAWVGRVLALGLVALAVILVLGALGVLDAIGGTASGFLGIGLGVLALFGAMVWTTESW